VNVFLEMMLRSSVVIAAGLAGLWLLRRQPAAFRHWMLAAVLLLAAAQPVINSVTPSWRLPAAVTSVEIDGPIFDSSFVTDQLIATVPAATATDWRRVLLIVWLTGAGLSLLIMLLGAIWLWWLGSQAVAAGANWRSVEAELRARLRIRRPVWIAVTRHPALLVTWGTIAPVILLPAGANAWSVDRIELVLAHEMAHLVRRDWAIQMLAEVIRAINWFNPLFWIACARLRRESEHACDDIVLGLGIGGTSYASHLVDLARTFSVHGRTWLPAPSIARPSTLERRVRAMLNPQVNRRRVSSSRRLALATLLIAIAVPIAAAARAQNTTTGTVTDPSGRPLGDAVVRLQSTSGESSVDTRTDANGNFQLPDAPGGDYLLSVRSPGFSTQRQRVRLSGGPVTFSIKLPVGTLRETVTVKGGGDAGPDAARSIATAPPYAAPTCVRDASGALQPPRKIRDVRPRYKQAWAGQGLKGSVLMQATIGSDGRVRNVELISGADSAELEDEAIAAVSLWEFSPTYLNCEPVEVRMFVTVNFTVD
jgi:TonB family protein